MERIAGRFRRALFSNANPRTEEYMLALCGERWPDVRVVRVDDADWLDAVGGADIVVLLYPDAIGQGFAAVEREVLRRKKRWAEVRVLNGRRRDFLLSPAARRPSPRASLPGTDDAGRVALPRAVHGGHADLAGHRLGQGAAMTD